MYSQRWRVDELAERTGLTVDTIRFYQKRRLVPPPDREGRIAWYGPNHVERIERIRQLQHEGLSLAVIGRLLDEDLTVADSLLAAAVANRELSVAESRLTPDELVQRTGVPAAVVDALTDAGLISQDAGGTFAASDADLVAAGIALLEAGLPLDELLHLARRHDEATHAIAEEAVAMFDRHVRQPILEGPGSAEDKAARLVKAFETLFPAVTDLVSHHFGRVILELAGEALGEAGANAGRERSA